MNRIGNSISIDQKRLQKKIQRGIKEKQKRISDRRQRLIHANKLMKLIGGCGRRFFYYAKEKRYAHFFFDSKNRLWYQDDYLVEAQPTFIPFYRRWKHMSHGGTMQRLLIALKNYIMVGLPVSRHHLGPWPDYIISHGDLWGYGKLTMEKLRAKAYKLPLFEQEEESA